MFGSVIKVIFVLVLYISVIGSVHFCAVSGIYVIAGIFYFLDRCLLSAFDIALVCYWASWFARGNTCEFLLFVLGACFLRGQLYYSNLVILCGSFRFLCICGTRK